MRVLFIKHIPSPYRVDFFNELSKYCELTVLYESDRATDRNEKWKGQADTGYKKVYLKGVRTGAEARFCPSVLKYIGKNKYDIIIVYGYSSPTGMLAISALSKKGIPFFLNADGGFIKQNESKLRRSIKRHFISRATWCLTTGSLTSDYFIHYGAKPDKIFEYPFTSVKEKDRLPAAIPKEKKMQIRESLGINCETLFLAVGQFIPRKGFCDFLKAWTSKRRDGMGLALIGGGPEERIYKQIAQGNSDIFILPFMEKSELAEYYCASDAFVLPTYEDIWGLVVNEAMSYGLPVFSTTGCISAATLEGVGVSVFPVGENEAMMAALESFANNEQREEMVAHVLERSREYTIENMVKRHVEIFERVASKTNAHCLTSQ